MTPSHTRPCPAGRGPCGRLCPRTASAAQPWGRHGSRASGWCPARSAPPSPWSMTLGPRPAPGTTWADPSHQRQRRAARRLHAGTRRRESACSCRIAATAPAARANRRAAA
eukprot:scaffold17197_cov101-Isochrysis_galbana.AAC.2